MSETTTVRQPQRIQLRRTKGWRKPEGAVVVGRPQRWGNQFVARQSPCGCWSVIGDDGPVAEHLDRPSQATQVAVDLFRAWIEGNTAWRDAARRELAGRDLACWCPLDRPCHADVLLEIANSDSE